MQCESTRTQNNSIGSTPNAQRKQGIHHSQTSIGRSIKKMDTSSSKPKFLERFNSFNPPRDMKENSFSPISHSRPKEDSLHNNHCSVFSSPVKMEDAATPFSQRAAKSS